MLFEIRKANPFILYQFAQEKRFIRNYHAQIRRRRKLLCVNELANQPTRANFASWIARIFSLKNSMSLNPYAWRFIVLILLFVPSIGPLEIITS